MKRMRVAIAVGVAVIGGGIAFALFDPSARVQGWIGGEPFFQGRSATAWRHDLNQEEVPATAAKDALAAGKADATPMCTWLLEHAPEATVRGRAADAIRAMGADGAPAGAALLKALDDPDPIVRGIVLQAIDGLVPNLPPDAVPRLISLFPNIEAIRAVAKFGEAGKEAIPALIKLNGHENTNVRFQAIRALGKIGRPSASFTPEVVKLLETDPAERIREISAEVLGMFGPAVAAEHPRVVPALMQALKDESWLVRRDAARSLGIMEALARPALVDLKPLEKDPDTRVREAAAKAVRQIEGAPKK
jgi:HEAT repeat protein